ncbi:MAG: hypothetical protein AAGE01_08890 [Pseudomonadota bacterium]
MHRAPFIYRWAPLALFVCIATDAFAQDERDRLKAEIETLGDRLELAAGGPAQRLATEELERARVWLEQADEARTRRILGLARMQYNNAAMDLKVAEAIVEAFELAQQRKQLLGQVEALEATVDEAGDAEGGEQ